MKNIKFILAIMLTVAIIAVSLLTGRPDNEKPKPYPLHTCLVCSMELASMGAPYVFVYKGQEIKLCSKSEQATFDKEPQKYLKRLADAEVKFKK